MKITKKDIDHVAQLARLRFPEAEKERFANQLNDILLYIDKLNQLNTEDVPPTPHVLPLDNVFREDKAKDSFGSEEILDNAPERAQNFFKVPKIIE